MVQLGYRRDPKNGVNWDTWKAHDPRPCTFGSTLGRSQATASPHRVG